MHTILPFVLEEIKKVVLERTSIAAITPAHCRILASQIFKTTQKRISDTTLKRIYGFALCGSKPSLYTLNLLSEYCGYPSWKDFSAQYLEKNSTSESLIVNDEKSVADILRKTTLNTLQALKSKSVIPYNLTVPREFVKEHLDIFLFGTQSATVLASPAGYGKTIALCHWVEAQLQHIITEQNGDQILFLNSHILKGLSERVSLTDWLLALLGMPAGHRLDVLIDRTRLANSNFYLIIDEFDADCYDNEHLHKLYSMLLDVLSLSKDMSNFKVILTMRSSSWLICKRRLELDNQINDWFLGFVDDNESNKNTPLFNSSEIKSLCTKINPQATVPDVLHPEISAFLSYPLFFQYYYLKNRNNFSLAELDHFRIYEVISSYIMDKLYSGRYTTEKIILMRHFIDAGIFRDGSFLISKLHVFEHIKTYKDAYLDLISIGFIREINHSAELEYGEYIEFVNKRLFTATMARKLVHDCGGYTEQLSIKISQIEVPELRLFVLKWCIFNAVKSKQYHVFKHMVKVVLPSPQKAVLISFLSSLIKKNFLLPDDIALENVTFDGHLQELFYYFFGIEFISIEYEKVLTDLLTLNLNEKLKIWINTSLGIISIVQLNSAGILNSIKALKAFPDEAYDSFQINPLYCIETIYNYFKYGVIDKKALKQITRFLFKGVSPNDKTNTVGSNNVLYLLALATLGIGGSKRKLIRFNKFLTQVHNNQSSYCPNYQFFIQISLADSYLDLGDNDNGLKIYNELLNEYQADRLRFTPYQKICLDYLTAQVIKFTEQSEKLKAVVEDIVYKTEKSPYRLMEINLLAFYLMNQKPDKTSDFYKAAKLKIKKHIHASGFSAESFMFNYLTAVAI